MEPDLGKLADSMQGLLDPKSFNCPKCGVSLSLQKFAKLQDTKLSMAITVAEGHKLQAATFGGMLTNMTKLLKSVAKDLGGKVEVTLSDVRISGREYVADFEVYAVHPPAAQQGKE